MTSALLPPRKAPPSRWAPLADRLRCPECSAALQTGDTSLECTGATRHRFPLVGGVPILLPQAERDALLPDLERAGQMRRDYARTPRGLLRHAAKVLVGSTHHLPVSPTVRRLWSGLGPGSALEVGSGATRAGPERVNLDIAPFPHVDVVGSALTLPFRDATFARVRSEAVLEHVRNPRRMIAEMHRVLAPGGYVYTEVPFLQHFHAWPNDFQRYTVEGLREAFSAFEIVETGVCVGPGSAVTALLADYCELFTFSDRRWVNDLVRLVPLVLLFPLKFLDRLLVRNPRAHEVASGLYVVARKP